MQASRKPTLADRLEELLHERTQDAIQEVVERRKALKAEEARDAWLKERLSEEDFREYWHLMHFGPAGEEFPRGWEAAAIEEAADKIDAAYRQGFLDGAQALALLLGVQQLPPAPRRT